MYLTCVQIHAYSENRFHFPNLKDVLKLRLDITK